MQFIHKRHFIVAVFTGLLLLPAAVLQAGEPGASWLRTNVLGNPATPSALNPNISVIGDMVGNSGPLSDSQSNRFSLRETELGLQAAVDPYARADFFVSFPEAESVELEEGYISLLSLPLGIKARGGKFRPSFGRLNMVHPHELPQVNAPLVITRFLGEEGLNDTGVEVSRIFAPFNVFTEVSYALLNGLGKEEPAEPTVTNITDVNGNVSTVTVKADPAATPRRGNSFGHVARIRFFSDLTDNLNVELGVSGALHQPVEGKKQTRMGGADFTVRWKPLQEGLYRSVTWRSEFLYSHRRMPAMLDVLTSAVTTPEREIHRRGAYSYVEIQPARRWRFGVRGDYVESPEEMNSTITYPDGSTRTFDISTTRGVAPFVTFTLSEFNRFRLQYDYRNTSTARENEHRLFVQWTVVLGPHGAHPY